MGEMPVLGDEQRIALAELLRSGAPKTPQYGSPHFDLKSSYDQGQRISKGLDNLSDAGDGSLWEGAKNKMGVGNPNIYADNYQAEFGQYDPAFNANPTGATTVPIGSAPVTPAPSSGMFGNMGNTMAGWFK